MKIHDYITYWDNVVKAWLIDDKKDESYKKEIELVLRNQKLGAILNENHLPEPYWGNPCKASFVILNFNPGGGSDTSAHTYWKCLGCTKNKCTLINYVNEKGYYETVKYFPLLNTSEKLDKSLESISKNYKGGQWWERKRQWLTNLAEAIGKPGVLPFAMELCGWHSSRWDSAVLKGLSKDDGLGKHFNETVILPMLDVLETNKTFAMCVGKSVGDLLASFGFENVTQEIYKSLNIQQNETETDHINVNVSKNNGQSVVAESKKNANRKGRNYRILKKDGCYVINTWVTGSNSSPGDDFFEFERKIIGTLFPSQR